MRGHHIIVICNVVELYDLYPRNTGYMDGRIVACYPKLPPMVGYAATATFRSAAPPTSGNVYAGLGEQVASFADLPGPPTTAGSPPAFVPSPVNNRLWHIPFNRVEHLPEQLIVGNEAVYFGFEFANQGGTLPDELVAYYVDLLSAPDVLPGCLGFYRAFDATLAQNAERTTTPLGMPVLAIGGAASYGEHVGEAMGALATDVRSVVIPDAGHWVAEQNPDAMLTALTTFLAPYLSALAAVGVGS